MALSSSTIWEVESGGSDTANGGAFDPSQTAGFFTDGVATVANTTAPIFSSASYNFVAGDAGHWIYLSSGSTGATVAGGWYKILNANDATSGTNKALIDGTIGNAVLKTVLTPSTVVGCANGASPTVITWTMDYSQKTAAIYTFSHLTTTGTGLVVTGGTLGDHAFGKQDVGNSLVITGGTNFNAGRYVIASVAAGAATVVGPTNISTGVGALGAGGQGGCLVSPAMPAGIKTAGNTVFIKTGTYSITSASTNIANGCVSDATGGTGLIWSGYGTIRGDLGTPPVLQAGNAISSFTIFTMTGASTAGSRVANITVDGASLTTSQGFSFVRRSIGYKLRAINCTNIGISAQAAILFGCSATNITGGTAAILSSASVLACEIYGNTVSGLVGISSTGLLLSRNLVYGNTGATSDGITPAGDAIIDGNTVYGNGRDGIRLTTEGAIVSNNLVEGNGVSANGTGINATAASTGFATQLLNNGVYNNTNVDVSANIPPSSTTITASGTFFTNAAGNDFSLNNTIGGGKLARAAGIQGTFPRGTSIGYVDLGAVQHADPAAGGSAVAIFGS